MSIIRMMGGLDLLVCLVILLTHYNVVGWRLGTVSALYLFIKAYAFKGDLASILDGVCGIWVLLVVIGMTSNLTFVIILYIAQKALMSLV